MSSETLFIIECPHCAQKIEVIQLNCRIFRCGILKQDYTQINPHLPKEDCIELKKQDKIYGCGKPFRVDESGNAIVCDYI